MSKNKKNNEEIIKTIYAISAYGMAGIDELLPKIKEANFKKMLIEMRGDYQTTSEIISEYASRQNIIGNEVNQVAKFNMWASTNMKTLFNNGTKDLAEILIKGEKMGIKKLNEVINNDMPADLNDIARNLLTIQKKHIKKAERFI